MRSKLKIFNDLVVFFNIFNQYYTDEGKRKRERDRHREREESECLGDTEKESRNVLKAFLIF